MFIDVLLITLQHFNIFLGFNYYIEFAKWFGPFPKDGAGILNVL